MNSIQQCAHCVRLLPTFFLAIGLTSLANAAKPGTPGAVAALPIVSLDFDDESGVLWKATSRSLARSVNEGRTWDPIRLPEAAHGNITSLTISAGSTKTIYLAAAGAGVLLSTDNGRTWTVRNRGLPGSDVLALAAHSTQPRTVYAYVPKKGIFRSKNAGASWEFFNRAPDESLVQFVHSRMRSKTETGWLIAATRSGVRRARNCFCQWESTGRIPFSIQAVAADPVWPARVYAAAHEGLFISPDGGNHWIRMRSPVAPLTALATTRSGRLFGALNGRVIRSVNRGVTWDIVE